MIDRLGVPLADDRAAYREALRRSHLLVDTILEDDRRDGFDWRIEIADESGRRVGTLRATWLSTDPAN